MSYTALLCLSIFAIYAVVGIPLMLRDYLEKRWPGLTVMRRCTCRADHIAAHRTTLAYGYNPPPYIPCSDCRARDTHVTQT